MDDFAAMNAVYEKIFGPHPLRERRSRRHVYPRQAWWIVGGIGPESAVEYYRSLFQIWREETIDGKRRGKTFFGYVIKVGYITLRAQR